MRPFVCKWVWTTFIVFGILAEGLFCPAAEYRQMKSASYEEVRAMIKPGDVIAFGGGKLSKVVHVGVILQKVFNGLKPFLGVRVCKGQGIRCNKTNSRWLSSFSFKNIPIDMNDLKNPI